MKAKEVSRETIVKLNAYLSQNSTEFHCNKTANHHPSDPIKLIDERRRIQAALESIGKKIHLNVLWCSGRKHARFVG